MQSLRVERLSDDLSGVALADQPQPVRNHGEVLVRVRAASLNFPDLLMTQGKYQLKPEPPFTIGLELAGEVIEADKDSLFKPGDKVIGGNKTGAFAEFACIPERGLRPLPRGLSFVHGAAMGAAYQTAYTGLVELCSLNAGQWVMVTGASGGVGLAAIDLAKALGAQVIAATNAPNGSNTVTWNFGNQSSSTSGQPGPNPVWQQEVCQTHVRSCAFF